MMKVRVTQIGNAIHPSEVVVAVKTLSGTETLVMDKRSIKNDAISIGYPIRSDGENFLIELPSESQSGSWRVWVPGDEIIEPQRLPA